MKILALEAKDFRAYTHASYQFGNIVDILGDNGMGKSSIAEAVVSALEGTTLHGSPRTDDLINNQGAKQFEVTIVFEVDGNSHEVTRVKGKKNELYVDGQKATQIDIDKLIGKKEHFLSVFAPGYFTSLSDKDARELLMGLIKPPSQDEVLSKLDKPSREALATEVLRDPEAAAKEWRASVKTIDTDVAKLEGRIEELNKRLSREIPEDKPFTKQAELDELSKQLAEKSTGNQSAIQQLQAEQRGLKRQYEMLKTQLRTVPNVPYNEGDPCPVCAQTLEGVALQLALENHVAHSNEIATANDHIKAQIEAVVERNKAIKAELERLEAQQEPEGLDELVDAINALETEAIEAKTQAGIIRRLHAEMAEDKLDLEKAQSDIDELRAEQFQLNEKIKAIGVYRSKLAEMQIAQLKQHLNKVDIKLFDIAKTTGEVKPVFDLLYEGKPFRALSYSEQIRVNLEIASLFNRVTGMDYPVFIDNAESITWFDPPAASQLFMARVEEGAELQVSSREPQVDEKKGSVA